MSTNFRRFLSAALCACALLCAHAHAHAQVAPARVISADYRRVEGARDRFPHLVVGAGRAAEGLRADWQRDLALVRRECGFEYVRFHGLLQDELGVYSEDRQGRPVYNFQYIDAVYDAVLDAGVRPFVEFGFMPQRMASGEKTIFWWKGNITPPRDYAKWEALVRALVEHWTERYGREEVRRWYFEVWNEPNLKDLFWSGDRDEYFKLYDVTARAVKSVSADYRVGGPATAGRGWVPEMIKHATEARVPLDFITTHDYGVSGRGLDAEGNQQLFLDPARDAIVSGVRGVRAQIEASALPNLPLHYTEWSTSYSPRDPVHDAYISAAYIVSRLKGAEGHADSMSYWTFTDIFEENGPVPSPFHGGFGLINFQGLRKPSFYAYQFLNRLGGEELASGDADSWVTRGGGGVQALFWNYTPPKTEESDQGYFKRDLPSKDLGGVRVSLSGLPPGSYTLSVYRVGYGVNDVYTDYLKMGSPPALTREQLRALAGRNDGTPVMIARVEVKASAPFVHDLPMRENDVYLLTLLPASANRDMKRGR
ncbi:MAG: glycoside hydrolase [Acidobacteria bacterium]|nr:glycoside hydrolase [Acidobacteriota bacterium]